MSASIPRISDPPRRVPAGARLALFDHHEITTSLNWTIPAAVCLLLSAIAQPLRGARIALVVVATICVLLSMRRAVPRISRALDSIKRMRWGRVTLGRIVSCRIGWRWTSMKPFDVFLKEWNALDEHSVVRKGIGCLFTGLAIFMAIPVVGFFLIFFMIVIIKVFDIRSVSVQGDVSFALFAQAVGGTIVLVIMFIVVRFIMRIYLMVKFEEMLNERRKPEEQVPLVSALERELREAISRPLPKTEKENPFPAESLNWILACKVEYPGAGKVQVARATARFCPQLNRSGVEPLLFHPASPGEVDLLIGLPAQVTLAGGEWAELPVARPASMLAITAIVFLADVGLLAYEGLSLLGTSPS